MALVKRPKTAAERAVRVKKILQGLDKMYPGVTCALSHQTPWELLVATILSAQCTDKRVNEVTPGLFAKYPTIQDFAAVRPEVLAQDIRSTGFFNNKAKSITGAARRVIADFNHSRRGTQDGECGARQRLWRRFRSGGGHARSAFVEASGSQQGIRSGQDRTRPDENYS
jgi:3-methyladenine DNA glycosylase/8-oxoguanine DNA glycosylase